MELQLALDLVNIPEAKEVVAVASRNLPPALSRENNEPMRCGSCWCLERYDDGRLKNAVNIPGTIIRSDEKRRSYIMIMNRKEPHSMSCSGFFVHCGHVQVTT